ncbi:MAG: AI-2E family transporter [Planctomycetes bacterium]|nr:AI-2E family transporter [Planctomycetota bacterium]
MSEEPTLLGQPAASSSFAPWSLVRRAVIWGVFLGILYLLRSFFPILLLTFVFSYAAGRTLTALQRRIPKSPRRPLVAAVFLGGIAALVGLGFLLGPHIREEQATFTMRFPEMKKSLARTIREWGAEHPKVFALLDEPEALADKIEKFELTDLGRHETTEDRPGILANVGSLLDVAKIAFLIASTLLFSLLFSFLIVLDLPRLRDEVEAIRASRIGWLYEEVRGTVVEFGAILGRTIESQAVIAMANTLLTYLGLTILGIPSKFLLSTIVFLCSFIPVLGVFISTTPIGLVALSTGGFVLVLECVAMVTLVHMVEAYVLNPRITGSFVHLNPVFVLAVLFIGEHLFGIWGLILGVPVAVTLLRKTRAIVRAPAAA